MRSKEKKHIKQMNTTFQKKTILKDEGLNSARWIWYALALVLVSTFAIYFKALNFDFLYTWDDNLYISTNNAIKDLKWENIKLFFTEFYVWNYQPITILSYAIEYKLAGNAASLFHFNNIVFHLLNTFLVFVLIRKLSPKNAMLALITSAFFAVHPMHVESVAWLAERKDVLYSFFFLLALILYIDYLKSNKFKYLILTAFFFLLSCLSKSAAVILPFVLLLLDYYFSRKYSLKLFAEKLPFFFISLVFGIVAMNSQTTAIPEALLNISFLDRISLVSYSVLSYLIKAVVPANLSAIYPYPIELGTNLHGIYYFSIFCLALMAFFVWFTQRWGKDGVFGFLFFLITIILVLQFIPIGSAAMADRYTYIPYIGIFFMVGKLFEYLSDGFKNKYINLVLLISFVVFLTIANSRVKVWRNDETLFSDAIKKDSFSMVAYNNRGSYYLTIAKNKFASDLKNQERFYRLALQDFESISKLNANYLHNYYNRGLSKYYLKNFIGAVKDFDNEIINDSNSPGVYFYRALAKNEIKDYAGAIKDFDKVLLFDSYVSEVYYNRGNAKKELNDYSGALRDYDKAIELDRKNIVVYNNRSILKCMLKDYEGAITDFDKMIELNPQDAATIKNREIIKSLRKDSSPK